MLKFYTKINSSLTRDFPASGQVVFQLFWPRMNRHDARRFLRLVQDTHDTNVYIGKELARQSADAKAAAAASARRK